MKNAVFSYKCATLICVTFLILLLLLLAGPISTPPRYQAYIDTRTWLDIPNAWDVLTNIPFFIAGIWGLWELFRKENHNPIRFNDSKEKLFYVIFFLGIILVGFGSAYFHWTLTPFSMVFDRAPITIAVAGFVCAMISERIDTPFARFMVWPLMVFGLFSVYYWFNSVTHGHEDIRLYVFTVGFFPIFIIPLTLILFKKAYTHASYIWAALIVFFLARISETYDKGIYFVTRDFISGHAVKHLLIGITYFLILAYLIRRKSILK